jgi:archaellum biogenesis protein FlaJ (TadC family)
MKAKTQMRLVLWFIISLTIINLIGFIIYLTTQNVDSMKMLCEINLMYALVIAGLVLLKLGGDYEG